VHCRESAIRRRHRASKPQGISSKRVLVFYSTNIAAPALATWRTCKRFHVSIYSRTVTRFTFYERCRYYLSFRIPR
ncbi:unnamed protein product, partial [Ascophyllum nodosum]